MNPLRPLLVWTKKTEIILEIKLFSLRFVSFIYAGDTSMEFWRDFAVIFKCFLGWWWLTIKEKLSIGLIWTFYTADFGPLRCFNVMHNNQIDVIPQILCVGHNLQFRKNSHCMKIELILITAAMQSLYRLQNYIYLLNRVLRSFSPNKLISLKPLRMHSMILRKH